MGTKLDAPMVVQRVCKRSVVKDLLFGVIDGISGAPSAAWLALLYIFIDRLRVNSMIAVQGEVLSPLTVQKVGILGLLMFCFMWLTLRMVTSQKQKEGKVWLFARLSIETLLLTIGAMAYLFVSGGLSGNFQITFVSVAWVSILCFAVVAGMIVALALFGIVLLIAITGFKGVKRA